MYPPTVLLMIKSVPAKATSSSSSSSRRSSISVGSFTSSGNSPSLPTTLPPSLHLLNSVPPPSAPPQSSSPLRPSMALLLPSRHLPLFFLFFSFPAVLIRPGQGPERWIDGSPAARAAGVGSGSVRNYLEAHGHPKILICEAKEKWWSNQQNRKQPLPTLRGCGRGSRFESSEKNAARRGSAAHRRPSCGRGRGENW
ncbi:hypothetical protein B0T20DRAFT_398772 [Sordaria brevicollis]|uniref:Uncharacterized protein n=1 Tax=Sordaria brevicollis TaxID=83679 RepID=A0AAE0PMU4_SORBR|nr:hypothetical protein B0T20DRAFT_398772 [Sordaria brevicollis]